MQFVIARISLVRLGNCLQNGGMLFHAVRFPGLKSCERYDQRINLIEFE